MQINQYLELTKLNSDLTDRQIDVAVEKTLISNFAGVSLPPFWVKRASRDLKNSSVNLITVVGFPMGYQMKEAKLKECELAIVNGANEVDLVLNISALKSGLPWVKIELAKCALLLHESEVVIKAILETPLLSNNEISDVSKMAADAGVDFIQTSTGFSSQDTEIEHINLIKRSVPANVEVKASGGINSLGKALSMIDAGATRIGSSRATKIFEEFQNSN